MASKTQIECLCEGKKGDGSGNRTSNDLVFINALMKALRPPWVRFEGSNVVRPQPCGNRAAVIKKMPDELKICLSRGGDTTLMVWADCDDNCADGDTLKAAFWDEATAQGITKEQFDQVVFIFAKGRLENWIEFLQTESTDESKEGPRVKNTRDVADAAKKLARLCAAGQQVAGMPLSLQWSCKNWRTLVERMK